MSKAQWDFDPGFDTLENLLAANHPLHAVLRIAELQAECLPLEDVPAALAIPTVLVPEPPLP